MEERDTYPSHQAEPQCSLEINHNDEGPWSGSGSYYTDFPSSDLFTGFSDKGSEGLPVHSAASLKMPTLRDAPLARKGAKYGG